MKKISITSALITICCILLAVGIVLLVMELTQTKRDPLLAQIDPNLNVTLGEYDHVAVTVEVGQITDQVVENDIYRRQAEAAQVVPVTDGAKQNDNVTLTYTGSIDGQETFSETQTNFIIGSQNNEFPIEGLSQHLLGVKAGDALTVNLTVQEEYPIPEWIGKTVVFAIRIEAIERALIPELDDAFAKTQGCNTVAELRALVKSQLQVIQQAANQTNIREHVWQQAKKNMIHQEAEVSAKANQKANEIVTELTNSAMQEGLDLLGYAYFVLGYQAENEADLTEHIAHTVTEDLLEDAFLVALCQKEQIILTDERYTEKVNADLKINHDAGFTDYTKENLIEDYGLNDETELKLHYLKELAIDRLMETAQVTTTLAK